jgi:hypothetical protein
MSYAYRLLCLEALAQPIAIDKLLIFIKKLKALIIYQVAGLMAGIFGRR